MRPFWQFDGGSFSQRTADKLWLANLNLVFDNGSVVSPRPGSPFTGKTLELLDFSSSIDMRFPVVTVKARKLGYRFLAAEARWIIEGDDRVATIAPYSPVIHKFSDNGENFFGAYGPRVKEQLQNVVDTLVRDRDSRQAVISIWRPNPPQTKDVPCTVAVQWLIRDGKIHCIDTMRSSDLWLGWPYDIFNFTMLTSVLALKLRDEGIHLTLGNLSLRAGSQHLYERDWNPAQLCISEPDMIKYAPLDLDKFADAESLIALLSSVADSRERKNLPWLGELFVV